MSKRRAGGKQGTQRFTVLHITDLELDPSPHALLGAVRMATGRDHGHPFTGQLVGGCQTNTRSATQDNGSLPLQCHRPLPLSRVPRHPAPVYAEHTVPCASPSPLMVIVAGSRALRGFGRLRLPVITVMPAVRVFPRSARMVAGQTSGASGGLMASAVRPFPHHWNRAIACSKSSAKALTTPPLRWRVHS